MAFASIARPALAAALAIGLAAQGHATTILAFTQSASGSPITATTNGTQTTTTLAATDAAVLIGTLDDAASAISAYFNFSALSTSAAGTLGSSIYQTYSGTFSITSEAGGMGTKYLAGAFDDLTIGSGSAVSLNASEPFNSVAFSSDVISNLGSPRALALSFSNITPQVSICNATICGFSSSVSGNFSAASVPEPATWAMFIGGFGMIGAGMRRRQRVTVSFA
jgi:hypothetical protein